MAILHTGNHSGLGSVPDLNGSLVMDHFNNFLWGHIPKQSCKLSGGLRTEHPNILFHLNMAESEEELKSLLIKVKGESENAGLKLSIQKTKIMASCPITSCKWMGKQSKQWQT